MLHESSPLQLLSAYTMRRVVFIPVSWCRVFDLPVWRAALTSVNSDVRRERVTAQTLWTLESHAESWAESPPLSLVSQLWPSGAEPSAGKWPPALLLPTEQSAWTNEVPGCMRPADSVRSFLWGAVILRLLWCNHSVLQEHVSQMDSQWLRFLKKFYRVVVMIYVNFLSSAS